MTGATDPTVTRVVPAVVAHAPDVEAVLVAAETRIAWAVGLLGSASHPLGDRRPVLAPLVTGVPRNPCLAVVAVFGPFDPNHLVGGHTLGTCLGLPSVDLLEVPVAAVQVGHRRQRSLLLCGLDRLLDRGDLLDRRLRLDWGDLLDRGLRLLHLPHLHGGEPAASIIPIEAEQVLLEAQSDDLRPPLAGHPLEVDGLTNGGNPLPGLPTPLVLRGSLQSVGQGTGSFHVELGHQYLLQG